MATTQCSAMHAGAPTTIGARFVRLIASVLALLVVATSAAGQTNAAGQFSGGKFRLTIRDAYSYWDVASNGTDRVVKVAVSNSEFRPDLLDAWYDRASAVRDLFINEYIKVVTFEFDADGKYRGYSYYFGSGDGCGYCYESTAQSTVRGADGRLKGKVSFSSTATTVAFEVAFDVPIPDKVWGDPLPMGGGDPGRVYLAYHKALVASDVDAVKAVSDARGKGLYEKHEREGRGREYFAFRSNDIHHRMQSVTIVGGFVRGDSAVVLFDGSSLQHGLLHGESTLRREGGIWLVDNELIQIGQR